MKYGITIEELSGGYCKQKILKVYKEIGFDAVDYSYDIHAVPSSVYDQDDYLDYVENLKLAAVEAGVAIYQMHAPLYHRRIDMPLTKGDQQEEKFLKKMAKRGFEIAEIPGYHYMVIHLRKIRFYDQIDAKEKARSYNLQMFREYEALARKYHVQIALENMFSYHPQIHMPVDTAFRTVEKITSYLERLNSDVFVACLDIGHMNINGISAVYMVKVLNQYLKVLHVHSNYAALDQHLLRGYGTIDWNAFSQPLHGTRFDDAISLETSVVCTHLPEISCLDYVRLAFRTASSLVK